MHIVPDPLCNLLIYPTVLVGFVSARDEYFLVILDADDVFPAAGKTVCTGGLVEDEDVEVTIDRSLCVQRLMLDSFVDAEGKGFITANNKSLLIHRDKEFLIGVQAQIVVLHAES